MWVQYQREKVSLGATLVLSRKLEHPLYVLTFGITTSYDFSLLRLERTIDLTRFPNVRPVCWPSVDPGVGQQVTSGDFHHIYISC